MKKYLVVKNYDTGKYFTCDYEVQWSRDIGHARLFTTHEEIELMLQLIGSEEDCTFDAFEYVGFLVVETVYKLE